MASKDRMQQFLYSFQHGLTSVHGVISLVAQVQASLVTQGITLTAVSYGTVGNSVTFTVTPGATAGAEVVTVTGNAISLQVETGVSTITQCVTALQASTASQALALATGSGTAAVATHAVQSLAGGIDGVVSSTIPGVSSVVQTGVGLIEVTFSDLYNTFLFGKAMLVKAVAQDLIPQIKSQTVTTTKKVVVELLTGATPTDPGAACSLYVMCWMRNSQITGGR